MNVIPLGDSPLRDGAAQAQGGATTRARGKARLKQRVAWIDALKWFCLAVMIVSHFRHVTDPYYSETWFYHFRKVIFPLFALAWAYTSKRSWPLEKYLVLLGWACAAQIPFTLLFGLRLNILFAFFWAGLPLPWSLLAASTVGQVTDGGILACYMLIFARHAVLPAPPDIRIKVPPAAGFQVIYCGHLAALVAYLLLT